MPVAEYKKLESKARNATPRGQAGFLIPWIVEHASPDQRKSLFRSAPPLRIVTGSTAAATAASTKCYSRPVDIAPCRRQVVRPPAEFTRSPN
jgi:hypothetical protein